jgi:hypothetical protein
MFLNKVSQFFINPLYTEINMRITNNVMIASVVTMITPFYGDVFSAIAQVSAKSLMPVLLVTLGIAS